ncbi:rhamnan synthesis F family protein [Mesorhizobium sp. NBSH29]|uniref:rhamnan synthesis F family protein n=1 Tax=Mesorhizobium sp. NBSH29 TaxID=2654249 RepID=UPI0018964F97|nr:rhamnan synthesis F family protein [Mesorhizobium sp. NBSH29]
MPLLVFHYPKVLAAALNWRNLTYKKTVLAEVSGTATYNSGRFAIFVMWQKHQTPWYVWNALNALNEAQANVVLVVNHELSQDRMNSLLPHVSTILFRNNAGMDIGGYKDATAFITRTAKPEKVAYLNDSVYYFKRGLSRVITRLFESPADVVGAFENWEIRYHLQSFCVSFSGRMFASEPFQKFWKKYLPVNSRVWAINRGEAILTKKILQTTNEIDIVFRLSDLSSTLETFNDKEAKSWPSFLPATIRPQTQEVRFLPATEIANLVSHRAATRSPIHTAGLLFTKYMENPLMKRDLVYRMQFDAREVERLLDKAGIDEGREHIFTEIRKKGMGSQLDFLDKIKFSAGIK